MKLTPRSHSHKETKTQWERFEEVNRALELRLREKLPEALAEQLRLREKLSEAVAEFVNVTHSLKLAIANVVRDHTAEKTHEPNSITGVEDGINQEQLELSLLVSSFEELGSCTSNENLTHVEALKLLAAKYHTDFKGMVTWLCAPDKHPELASKAVLFLQENLDRTRVRLFDTAATLCNGSGDTHPIFYLRSDDYHSIMSPICEFIFNRIERYHDRELDLREAVPIQICERANCGKFFLAKRIGRKRYCSSVCRALAFQKRVDWARYMRGYRKTVKARQIRRTQGKR
jgi:hypothetical protein